MIVKHVWDKEGRAYAIPEHILEDFETSESVPLPSSVPGLESSAFRQPDLGNGEYQLLSFGGYGNISEFTEIVDPDPNSLLSVLSQLLWDTRVTSTLGQLTSALGLIEIQRLTGQAAPGTRPASPATVSDAASEHDSRPVDPATEVAEIIELLSDPGMSNLPVSVSLAAVRQVRQLITGLSKRRAQRKACLRM